MVFACILLWFPILDFYRFCPISVLYFLFVLFFILGFFFSKERERKGWACVNKEMGRIWEKMGMANHGQTVLYEKKIF